MTSWIIAGFVIIAFILGVGFLLGFAVGKISGREEGIKEKSDRWKAQGQWIVTKGERHE